MLEVRRIDPEMTYNIRHAILRPHRQLEDCIYKTDHEAGSFHVGAFSMGQLISVVSFCVDINSNFSSQKQYRLRGMATLEEYRKLGAGKLLVSYSENLLREKDVELLWCKARTSVLEYYKKLGFSNYGEVFDYPTIGPHIVMYKKLT